jgi:hypothetical protein
MYRYDPIKETVSFGPKQNNNSGEINTKQYTLPLAQVVLHNQIFVWFI